MSDLAEFPLVWDSTMVAIARSCGRKLELSHIEHWKPKDESIHLVAGKAFARGVEEARVAHYVEGKPPEDAVARGLHALILEYGDMECPEDSAKSLDRMCGALEFYFAHYPLGKDTAIPVLLGAEKRGIEFSFAEPLPICHPVTGDPLIYAGRADMIAHFASAIYGFDEKTTKSLGATWSKQWALRSQFTGYCWAARRIGIPLAGIIVRGVSILKTKYETQEAITNRSEWEIERWLRQVCDDIEGVMRQWRRGWFSYNLDHSCTEYGGCQFSSVCVSPTPEEWLPMYFEKRVWNPLTREERHAVDI